MKLKNKKAAPLTSKGEQKIKKPRKPEKNNWKNWTVKKNRLNRLEFFKNRPVRFWFYKPETKKTELNPNRKKTKKTSQTRKNRAKPKNPSPIEKTEPNWKITDFCSKITESKPVGLNQFWFFLKKNWFDFFFVDKN